MPPGTRAELIEGVVYMPSPVGDQHGENKKTSSVIYWLYSYKQQTPGVRVLDNATAELDDFAETQPDAMLRILPECGGQTRRTDRGYIAGAPRVGHRSRTGIATRRPGSQADRRPVRGSLNTSSGPWIP